ncbi:hypothetical protein AVEN_45211-1 [Araneus ventricosus]|uniref:Uncharacterized protein n=1 Tax=Araneus ventricosus TaxID=182803 RepID=A0A4Y1ZUA0_ARAVE|nr:hypothetical protein AVEN_45211-1 [Araneus ventricosus]
MRSKKQTERQLLLMESSLAYPRGKEKKQETQGRKKTEGGQTLGYLGVVKPVTPKEDVPLRGSPTREGSHRLWTFPASALTLVLAGTYTLRVTYRNVDHP